LERCSSLYRFINFEDQQPTLDLTDPPLEIVDQLKARLDVTAPRRSGPC